MNESLISGLLGAVMGGATSIEKSLAEEEAARRKEEEEKRREERAITLAERQEAMREARKAAQEKAKMERIASYLPAATGATPSQSPMEPEGGGITEYQVPTEQRLVRGFEAAMAKGDTDAAKVFSDQYKALKQEERAQAEEARKQDEFARGKPEKKTPQMQNVEDLAKEFYGGDDPERIAQARRQAINRIFPEREARVAGGQRPPTAGQLMAAEGRIGSKIKESFTEGFGDKKKVNQDLVDRAIPIAINLVDKSDPSKKLDVLKIQNDAISQVRSARKKAEDYAGSQWDALKDKGGVTRSRYIERNYLSYIDDYLSGGNPKEQESSAGAPWTRNWRQ